MRLKAILLENLGFVHLDSQGVVNLNSPAFCVSPRLAMFRQSNTL